MKLSVERNRTMVRFPVTDAECRREKEKVEDGSPLFSRRHFCSLTLHPHRAGLRASVPAGPAIALFSPRQALPVMRFLVH